MWPMKSLLGHGGDARQQNAGRRTLTRRHPGFHQGWLGRALHDHPAGYDGAKAIDGRLAQIAAEIDGDGIWGSTGARAT